MAIKEPPTVKGMTSRIHSTFAPPGATWQEVLAFAARTAAYRFPVLAIQGCWAEDVKQLLRGRGTKLAVFVGFTLGGSPAASKVAEVRKGLEAGAEMFEYLPNIGFLRSGLFTRFKDEVRAVVRAAEGRPVCATLELPSLSIDERIRAAGLVEACGVEIVNSSSGRGMEGSATFECITMLRSLVSSKTKVKASGGIEDLETAIELLDSGADFIGTWSGFQIIDELKRRKKR